MVIMDPCEAEALLRVTATINGLSSKAATLSYTTTSLYFICKGFVMSNRFYKDGNTAHNTSNLRNA